MNIMLLIVSVASFAIGQAATGLFVLGLVTFNVVMGSNQELKARASVEALAQLQVPHARVRRSGGTEEVDSRGLVPGDVVLLEAGDLVPADGRLVSSATLEVQEAALTGESAPVPKDTNPIAGDDVALGDRTDMVFQNTQVTRGSASAIVTATGQSTQMGRIADMVTATKRSRSPLQRELDGLTKVFGVLAWSAVAVIAIVGIVRGQDRDTLLLLCISTAIASIPVGLPTFVQAMLSSGAQRLAESKAVVKTLTDVETLGGTTVINSDKTGTLTMNAMTATTMLAGGEWFTIEGGGYQKSGAILGSGGAELPTSGGWRSVSVSARMPPSPMTSRSSATPRRRRSWCWPPRRAWTPSRRARRSLDARRCRSTPSTSSWRRSTTSPNISGRDHPGAHFASVKGAPDVVIELCDRALWHGQAIPIDGVRDEILAANQQLSERGLRVLAFAARDLDDAAMDAAIGDPMAAVTDLVLVALVGIIDPLREEAKESVRIALRAGVDVRMITGDHTVTARAIADQLGLGPGVITGTELAHLPDDEVIERLPELHVFGRVAPEDKVRLARLMQEAGHVVAMTGDAVNDAAALKQADIGVAMGSGSEVTKQAAKIVLTDDNFATLVARGRPGPRHLPADHVVREATADDPVLGAAADAARHDLQHQRRRGAVPDAAAVLQVLRGGHRGHRVHRGRPGSERDAASAAQTGHEDRHRSPDRAVGRQRLRRRGERARGARMGAGQAEHDARLDLHDDGVRDRGDERRQPRPGDAARTRAGVVVARLPLPGLDHPGLDAHVGGGGAQHAAAVARHRLAHGEAVGRRARAVA